MNAKANLMLHPVRMRIVQTLIGGRRLTVQEMGQRLADVPQATLYRHLNKLVQGGIVEAVAQNQVRGTIEKVYALTSDAGISPQEFIESSNEEKMGVFMQFVNGLVTSFDSYLNQEQIDFMKDGVTFRQADLYMNDEEFHEFAQSLAAVFQRFIQNNIREDRKRRTVATIIIPEAGKEGDG